MQTFTTEEMKNNINHFTFLDGDIIRIYSSSNTLLHEYVIKEVD